MAAGITNMDGTASTADRVEILGCPVDALDMRATVARCLALAEDGHGHRHVAVNAAKLVTCARDRWMTDYVRGSDVVSADGQSVVWAARFLGAPLPERVAGIDLMHELLAEAERRGLRVYLLGAKPAVLARAIDRLAERHPRLHIVGSHHGYFSRDEEDQVAEQLRSAAPDILFVAMSSPHKEQWLGRHLNELEIPFAMGVGGAIDIIAGERSRAPRWMQRAGVEWLHRLLQEPNRMWRRYFVGNLRFVLLVVRQRLRRGIN